MDDLIIDPVPARWDPLFGESLTKVEFRHLNPNLKRFIKRHNNKASRRLVKDALKLHLSS